MKRFLFLLAISTSVFASESTVQLSEQQVENLGIVLGKVTSITEVPVLYAPANVLIPPNNEYIVSTSQGGIVNQLNAALGDEVKKGAVLAQIDSPDLLRLQSNYLKASSVLKLASSAYQRDKALVNDGVIANRRLQETESQFNSATLDVQEAKRLLEIAGGNTNGQLNSHLAVHSPTSGVVIERMATVGTRVDNLTPLYRVANLQTLWLEIAIPQEQIASIKVGDKVQIENTPFKAEISLIGQHVDTKNQTVLARAIVKNAQQQIRVGQKLNVLISQMSHENMFKVPNTAVAQNDGNAFVFVKNATGFEVRPITTISKKDEETIISGELSANETVALKGAAVLKANWLGLGSSEE